MTPEAMQITLKRLEAEGVDIGPAQGLEGPELEAWIDQAEEALFQRLYAEFKEARDLKCALRD
ncbi:TPA: hypothetical protein ACWSZ1_005175 [Escherichia coli]|jgi:hypothetical protein|uniref:hypothetical protein n=1 Tax=Escherichia coli TaxID=562 RepID=UPI000FABDBA4|nr:hypothetical protein [Escherichia coli]EFT3826530.1 hypothetical protein [Shigella sonnei]HAY5832494.1 hypothetical protein [Shigella flexneri 2a]EFK2136470.1 hypothetical protein [Escherichia coli]EFT6167104.1 hypothetical protein [Shigella sonnei]EFX8584853.1 hypothetical protein [Shigella sonnei]